MDTKSMIESHRELLETVAASLRERGFDKALLQRPVELQEQRAAGVKARIAALEAARREYVDKVDRDIKLLKGELSTIETSIKTERDQLASLAQPTTSKSTGTKGSTTAAGAASRVRPSKTAATRIAAKPTAKSKAAAGKGSKGGKGGGG